MFVAHCTKKLRDRLRPEALVSDDRLTTTRLGAWYATALFWRPQVALFVNEVTLLPVLVPLAPAASLLDRFPDELATVLRWYKIDEQLVESELEEMHRYAVGKTANRSVLGIMNEFTYLGEGYREDTSELLQISLKLAQTPCSPLYRRHVSPDQELLAWFQSPEAAAPA